MRAALFTILIAVLAMFLLTGTMDSPADAAAPSPSTGGAYTFAPTESRQPTGAAEAESGSDSGTFTMLLNGENVEISMRDYLIGTLAAEMPADFQMEALKAQAVAARTYALYKAAQGTAAHPEAAVCGDAGCCAAYQSPEALLEKWGPDFYARLQKIQDAVDETAGLCLVWEDAPILAVFHSSSGGETESCAAVWGTDLPYLVSVSSPETGETVGSSVLVAWSDFIETVKAAYPEAEFGENRADWFQVTERTQSGRAAWVSAGGVAISGMDFRFLFGLRSTDFEAAAQEDGLLFTVSGYGHGVGMSQYGAETLAENGSTFSDILGHYYPGTTLHPLAISDILG